MASKKGLSALKKKVHTVELNEYRTIVDQLGQFASDLSTQILETDDISVHVEAGFRVNIGQQFKIVLHVQTQTFRDILIRTYVPPTGYPVVVRFTGVERQAENNNELVRILYEEIPSNEGVQSRLQALLALAG